MSDELDRRVRMPPRSEVRVTFKARYMGKGKPRPFRDDEQGSDETMKRLPPPSPQAYDFLRRALSNPVMLALLARLRER